MKRDLQKILGDLEPLKKERKIKVNTGAIEELLALYELELKALSAVRGKNTRQRLAALDELEKSNNKKFAGMRIDANTLLDFISHAPPYFDKYKAIRRVFGLANYEADRYYVHVGILTANFINRLIATSYKKGNNNFIIPTEFFPTPLLNLCDRLEGRANKLLRVKIIGDVGQSCGNHSKYVDLTLEGKPDIYFGKKAENCIFRCTEEGPLRAMMGGDDGLPIPMDVWDSANKNCRLYLITKNGEVEIGHT